jgi:hypothetical protein
MKTISMLLAVALLAIASCGDNNKLTDAGHADARADAACSNCPAVPALGVQLDRLGRPAINTALNHAFDPTAAAGTAKDAYNVDGSPGGWVAAYAPTFAAGLGIMDVLDTGLTCTDGTCVAESAPTASDGCGNQVLYNGNAAGGDTATATSYATLASILADDQLYMDTTKTSCELPSHANYLAVEFNVVTSLPNLTCGGRAPTNDVIDTSYTALAIGVTGFKVGDGSYTPFFGDGVGPHADVSNSAFPFLGTPH